MSYLPALVLILIVLFQGTAWARFIDEAQTLRVNGRVYNRMAMAVEDAADFSRLQTPYNSFNMLQSRTFVQMELRHDLIDLVNNEYEGNLNILAPIFAPFRVLGLEAPELFHDLSRGVRRGLGLRAGRVQRTLPDPRRLWNGHQAGRAANRALSTGCTPFRHPTRSAQPAPAF